MASQDKSCELLCIILLQGLVGSRYVKFMAKLEETDEVWKNDVDKEESATDSDETCNWMRMIQGQPRSGNQVARRAVRCTMHS